jgi:hypothetical protein
MVKKICVYIKNVNVISTQGFVRPLADHYCTDRTVSKTERILPESDELTLKIVKEFAKEKGLDVEVCNVHTFTGKLKARIRGVRVTPTVLLSQSRIEGDLTPETLRTRLESFTF